jgi:hypothetical protein
MLTVPAAYAGEPQDVPSRLHKRQASLQEKTIAVITAATLFEG